MTEPQHKNPHVFELGWNEDLKKIYDILIKFYISMPSIIDITGAPRLPIIFESLKEGYENPYNVHKQALWLDRITNPTEDVIRLIQLLDKYNLHHNIDFFHTSTHEKFRDFYLPHRHLPGGAIRSVAEDNQSVTEFNGPNPGEKNVQMQTVYGQLTFPFINSSTAETQWSSTYDLPFNERRPFTEEEITGRYILKDKPVMFDVMSWHSGKTLENFKERVIIGCPSKSESFSDAVSHFT
jgi:hypothetical protein